jgi:hypothetical protein
MSILSSARVAYEPIRSLAFGDISGTYAAVGTPFTSPIRNLKFQNFTDQNLLISFDGSTNHDVIAANGYAVWDYGSNKASQVGFFEQPQGTRVYVKQESGSAPSVGSFYVTTIYASNV